VNGLGFGVWDFIGIWTLGFKLISYSPVGVKIPERNFKLFGIS
jgi:hypothetical protein